ncbi:DinB family protein [Micromonospora sp. HK10]|uniref:DinB family protein n=1 Tax=Micromonospora sp. HK10 TaxID=1538294 RepID=UPI000B0DEAC0|nr:DinB family protein [Micromonospora sp. HK10]
MPLPAMPIETDLLLAHLNGQRQHVLGILDGLDEDALRRPVLPSGWSCLGLVRHLTEDVERFWFRCVMGGEPTAIVALSQGTEAWQVDPDVPAAVVLDRYRQEIDRANAVLAGTPLDAPPAWWPPDQLGDWRLASAREVILHVITETACHAGHLDAVRELIDGRTWLVITT